VTGGYKMPIIIKRKWSKIEKLLLIAAALVAAITIAVLVYGVTATTIKAREEIARRRQVDSLPIATKQIPVELHQPSDKNKAPPLLSGFPVDMEKRDGIRFFEYTTF